MAEEQWQRNHWKEGGDRPFVFLVIYGIIDFPATIRGREYRTRGIPDYIEARSFERSTHAKYLRESYEEGYAWELLCNEDPELAELIESSPGAIALAGEVADATSLMYLRDVIGTAAALLDSGAVALYDPFTFRWWRPETWKVVFHAPDEPQPKKHVVILYSAERDGLWLHTRGLLTFGRPDLSVRGVSQADIGTAAGMLNELIELQAFGGRLADGETVRHPSLGSFKVQYAGDRDDPDFNNVHVELERKN